VRGGVVSGRRWFLLSMDLSRFAAGAAGPGGEEGWSGAGAGEGKGADWLAGWLVHCPLHADPPVDLKIACPNNTQ
jgi:hypothetical protein